MQAKIERNFSRWFELQFGKRPAGPATDVRLVETLSQARQRLAIAESAWERRLHYLQLRDAAYKAWLAKEAADGAE